MGVARLWAHSTLWMATTNNNPNTVLASRTSFPIPFRWASPDSGRILLCGWQQRTTIQILSLQVGHHFQYLFDGRRPTLGAFYSVDGNNEQQSKYCPCKSDIISNTFSMGVARLWAHSTLWMATTNNNPNTVL